MELLVPESSDNALVVGPYFQKGWSGICRPRALHRFVEKKLGSCWIHENAGPWELGGACLGEAAEALKLKPYLLMRYGDVFCTHMSTQHEVQEL